MLEHFLCISLCTPVQNQSEFAIFRANFTQQCKRCVATRIPSDLPSVQKSSHPFLKLLMNTFRELRSSFHLLGLVFMVTGFEMSCFALCTVLARWVFKRMNTCEFCPGCKERQWWRTTGGVTCRWLCLLFMHKMKWCCFETTKEWTIRQTLLLLWSLLSEAGPTKQTQASATLMGMKHYDLDVLPLQTFWACLALSVESLWSHGEESVSVFYTWSQSVLTQTQQRAKYPTADENFSRFFNIWSKKRISNANLKPTAMQSTKIHVTWGEMYEIIDVFPKDRNKIFKPDRNSQQECLLSIR